MDEIEQWVYDPQSDKCKQFEIQSFSLRKALNRQLSKTYMNQGVFMDYDRNTTTVKIKKSKGFRQSNFLRGFANPHSQSDRDNTAQLGFCDSQSAHEPEDEQTEFAPNERSGTSDEKG